MPHRTHAAPAAAPSAFLFVKPADDLKVRDPVTKNHLPPYGRRVPADSYWYRRLRSRDVVITTEAEIEAGAKAAVAHAKHEADKAAALEHKATPKE